MRPKIDYTLCLVTDREAMSTPSLENAVESALAGGCTWVQLREKDVTTLEFYELAVRVRQVTDRHGIPLIINDRVDIAAAVNSAGVHVGQSDLPVREVRKILGPDKIVGVSVSNLFEAVSAVANGADYLGVGSMFATGTKPDVREVPVEELRRIRKSIRVPLIAIGGINVERMRLLRKTGIDGIAVVSAILAQPNIEKAAKRIKKAFIAACSNGKPPTNLNQARRD